jgi:3-oxoacyl-[acyl-carrier protein] reductase
MDVKDRVVLVAGAATDVGAAISFRLAKGSATIVLVDSDREAISSLEKKIIAVGHKAKAWEVNMTKEADVDAAVQAISGKFGSIDILVN